MPQSYYLQFARDFLYVLYHLVGFDVAPPSPPKHVSLSRGVEQGIREIDFNLTGDFLLVSKRCQREEEDDLISQLSVERVDSNSGAETRQGQKKRKWEVKPRPQYSRMPQWNLNQNTQSDRAGGRG